MSAASSIAPKAVVAALLATVAFGILARSEVAPLPVAQAASCNADGLPAEFRAIRPADLDGGVPPIPPAELWPAQ